MKPDIEIAPRQPLDPTKFENDLHKALRLCQKPHDQTNPLDYLTLYKQAYAKTGHIRRALNKVLYSGLKHLEANSILGTDLLTARFLNGEQVHTLAVRLSVSDTQIYNLQREAIHRLADILLQMEGEVRNEVQAKLERRLDLPPPVELFGVSDHLMTLLDCLNAPKRPWLMSIEGLGGIGKTALANALVRQLALTACFVKEIAWVSAKQQTFLPSSNLQPADQPALDSDTLITALLEQLQSGESPLPPSPQDKIAALTKLLKSAPYFIVIDNLETILDYEALLPTLNKLANPTQFLLTSRYSLRGYEDIYCYGLSELSLTDTIDFLKHEAKSRSIRALDQASQSQLEQIYEVVGGNPLALKLVKAQISHLSLPRVLNQLKKARGKKSNELYTFIYWQAWHLLDKLSKRALLAMPFAQNGDIDQLCAVSELDEDDLTEGLEQLVNLSLVEVSGDLADLRYRIHQLTRTFLLTEVAPEWNNAN